MNSLEASMKLPPAGTTADANTEGEAAPAGESNIHVSFLLDF